MQPNRLTSRDDGKCVQELNSSFSKTKKLASRLINVSTVVGVCDKYTKVDNRIRRDLHKIRRRHFSTS